MTYCPHGIRNLRTNLPYCRECDAENNVTDTAKPDRAEMIASVETESEPITMIINVPGFSASFAIPQEHIPALIDWLIAHRIK
jgi:hypothetical protein